MKALLSLACACAVLGASDVLASGIRGTCRDLQASALGIRYSMASGDPQQLQDMGDEAEDLVLGLFQSTAGAPGITWGDVPEGFADELFDPGELGCSTVVFASGTVGLVCDASGEDARKRVSALMRESGWAEVPGSEGDFYCTYVKDGGDYRWAYVTCSDVSGTVTVSISVQGPNGKLF